MRLPFFEVKSSWCMDLLQLVVDRTQMTKIFPQMQGLVCFFYPWDRIRKKSTSRLSFSPADRSFQTSESWGEIPSTNSFAGALPCKQFIAAAGFWCWPQKEELPCDLYVVCFYKSQSKSHTPLMSLWFLYKKRTPKMSWNSKPWFQIWMFGDVQPFAISQNVVHHPTEATTV